MGEAKATEPAAATASTAREALEAGLLYIAYQPIVDLESKQVFGYEALVRSEAVQLPSPPAILTSAVQTNFMGQLGRALRRMAVENCQSHPLFLNVHPNEFDEAWLVRPDDSIVIHDRDIFLEITESVPLSHYRYCHSVLAEIRTRGTKIAVDDLGAGYSNLKYIADLAPEGVKLDRELVADLHRDRRLQRLVSSIVELCRQQDARVVAEGIETVEELKAVIDTGAHYGQGYYLARPNRIPPAVDHDLFP